MQVAQLHKGSLCVVAVDGGVQACLPVKHVACSRFDSTGPGALNACVSSPPPPHAFSEPYTLHPKTPLGTVAEQWLTHMPMKTTFVGRCPNTSSTVMTWSTISCAARLRAKPPLPVAQKVQRIGQPTCRDGARGGKGSGGGGAQHRQEHVTWGEGRQCIPLPMPTAPDTHTCVDGVPSNATNWLTHTCPAPSTTPESIQHPPIQHTRSLTHPPTCPPTPRTCDDTQTVSRCLPASSVTGMPTVSTTRPSASCSSSFWVLSGALTEWCITERPVTTPGVVGRAKEGQGLQQVWGEG